MHHGGHLILSIYFQFAPLSLKHPYTSLHCVGKINPHFHLQTNTIHMKYTCIYTYIFSFFIILAPQCQYRLFVRCLFVCDLRAHGGRKPPTRRLIFTWACSNQGTKDDGQIIHFYFLHVGHLKSGFLHAPTKIRTRGVQIMTVVPKG